MSQLVFRIKKIIKEQILWFKFYKNKKEKNKKNQIVFFVSKGYPQPHPGLVDRFKAIVGLYYIAKQNKRDFILKYDYPFPLEKYLKPNQCLWDRQKDISFCKKDVQLYYYGKERDVPILQKDVGQYHCYYYEGLNILRRINLENWQQEWGNLFRELFSKTAYLEELLNKNLPKEPYVAVHIRFVNALDSFEKGFEKNLSESEKENLIEKCFDALKLISKKETRKIYLFSDSVRFLEEAKKRNFLMLPFENVGHISYEDNREVFDKTFIDFFAMADSQKVYSIQGEYLYESVFSQYASFIENIDYEIVKI